jgi:hypothetical protein
VVTGSLRLRFPFDQTTSMCPASTSMCPACRARVSPVRSPHECISVKNATACHRHGDWVLSATAAAKNNSICLLLSK